MKTLLLSLALVSPLAEAVDYPLCYQEGDGSVHMDVRIEEGDLIIYGANYLKPNCEPDSLVDVIIHEAAMNKEVDHVRLTLKNTFLVPLDEGFVEILNEKQECDFANWEVGVGYEMRNQDCYGIDSRPGDEMNVKLRQRKDGISLDSLDD